MTESDDERRNRTDPDDRPNGPGRHAAVETADGFHEALQKLVTEASSNGVDVRGSWPVAGSEGQTSWDIEIARIAHRSVFHLDESDDPIVAIVEAVAALEGVDTTDLQPLYDAIDPDVIDTVARSDDDADRQARFEYCGYEITVRADGSVLVDE
jgi:hypothetical protein